MLGKTVSHYEITRVLGAGAMGEVYAARDTLLGRNVAIKILHSRGRASEGRRLRFMQEARAASALNHPNIITIHDVVRDGEVDCIVMELVSGQTLRARMLLGPLPLEETLDVLDRIADALAAAHAGGIIHRDLKPANVMLTQSGGLKVLDFGLAKLMANMDAPPEVNPALTQSDAVVGTPSYMSPEQVFGETLDGRSDLFAVGSIGVEMLTGRNPFESDSVVSTLHEIAYGAPPSFEDVPGDAVPIFERLLERDKAERYQSADDLRHAIAQVRAGLAQTASLRVRPARRRNPPRQRIGFIAIGVLMILAIGIGAAQLWRTGADAAAPTPAHTSAEDPFRPPPTAHGHVRHANELLSTPWRKGYVAKAIEELQRAIAIDPTHAPAHAALAKAYWVHYQKQKDKSWLDLALGNARHAVELDPQLAAAHAVLGATELANGNLDTAEKELEQALVIDPGNTTAHKGLSDVASRRNDEVKAEAELRKAVELEPRNPNLYSALGNFLYHRTRYREAEDAFRKEITFAPDHSQPYINLGAVLQLRGDNAGAARTLQQALEIEPAAMTYSNLGTLYFFQGLYPQSVAAFEKAVELGANRYVYWGNLGDAYRWTPGNRAKARDAFTTAIHLVEDDLRENPDDPKLQTFRALYLAKQGNAPAALAAADALMKRKEMNPQSFYRLALAYELAGARAKSLDALALAIRNGYPTAEVRADPEFVSLRRDAQYQRLMAEVR